MIKRILAFILGIKQSSHRMPFIRTVHAGQQQSASPDQNHSGMRHQETEKYVITDIINGHMPRSLEIRSLDSHGVTVQRNRAKVKTASNTLVDPENVQGFCDVCGLPLDIQPFSCDVCAASLCCRDILCIQAPSGIIQGCHQCIGRILRNWNHWIDGNPPIPFSITRLERKGPGSHEQSH